MTRSAVPLLLFAAACGTPSLPAPTPVPVPDTESGGASGTRLPPVTPRSGPPAIRVVYPPEGSVVAVDSSFIFGSVGTGDATLAINGRPVHVWPNGAWLAWVAFPAESLMRLQLVARTATETVIDTLELRRPVTSRARDALWIDAASATPSGRVWWPAGEYLPLAVRATAGAEVRLVLPDSTVIPLVARPTLSDVSWGTRAFDRDTGNLARSVTSDRYVGVLRGRALGPSPGPFLGDTARSAPIPAAGCAVTDSLAEPPAGCAGAAPALPVIEAILGADTVRAEWPLRLALLDSLPYVVELDDDPEGTGTTDGITVGRARPGATYNWFFPRGTRTEATGQVNGNVRLRLSTGAEAWVAAGDVRPLPARVPLDRATVGSVALTAAADRFILRIPVSRRVPFAVNEEAASITLRLYHAAGDVNWIRYGGTVPGIRAITWSQEGRDEVTLTVSLDERTWGYRTRWAQDDLMLEVRRPPALDAGHPLRGVLVVVDPGHPPAGATGPTGLREAEANLAVGLRLRDLLAAEGARVIMTRTTDRDVGLTERTQLADSVGADLLVSIHNNALPDGVNPFTNNGASVYYNHVHSIPLARAVQGELVRAFGTRDLGFGRGDLALVRPTWMPAILTEGLFMMLPDQEAALRSVAGQEAYARAVRNGIVSFLRWRAGGGTSSPASGDLD